MKSKTSLFSKAVWKQNLKGYWWLLAGMLVFYLANMMGAYEGISGAGYESLNETERAARVIGHLLSLGDQRFLIFYAAFAAITAALMFSYLFQTRNAYMMHTFPIGRRKLFITNYLSGLCFLLIPQLVSALSLWLACQNAGVKISGYLGTFLLFCLGETLFFYSLEIFFIMLTGNFITALAFFLIANIFEQGIRMVVNSLFTLLSYGMDGSFSGYGYSIFSPVSYMDSRLGIQLAEGDGLERFVVMGQRDLAIYVAAALLLTAAAFAFYLKRTMEKTGDLLCVEWLKPIFRWGVTICTTLVGVMWFYARSDARRTQTGIGFFIFLAVCAIIVFCAVQMLLDQNVRIWNVRRIAEGLACAAALCLVCILIKGDVLGIEGRVPEPSQVKSAYLSTNQWIREDTPERIGRITAIHQSILDSKKEFLEYEGKRVQEGYVLVWICYLLKDGEILKRCYIVPAAESYFKDEDSVVAALASYQNEADIIKKGLFGLEYASTSVVGGSFPTEPQENRLSKADAQRLYQAYLKDIEEGNVDNGPFAISEKQDNGAEDAQKYKSNFCLTLHNPQGYRYAYDLYCSEIRGENQDFVRYAEGDKGEYFHFTSDCRHTVLELQRLGLLTEEELRMEY